MKDNRLSRRNFFQKTTLASGSILLGPVSNIAQPSPQQIKRSGLPREVWIAGFSLMDMRQETPELMIAQVFEKLKDLETVKPDILCLPEMFPFMNVNKKTTLKEKVAISEKAVAQFSDYSKKNNCYTICPVITRENGKIYNAAVILDRKGNRLGDYKKIRVTVSQVEEGVTPGPIDPPVFETDFGTIGVQICWDIAWNDGWKRLRKKGAEIIFWPSAYAGGKMVDAMAWQNKCVIVSSTVKNTAKICDISGEIITQTGIWSPNIFFSPVNLDKVFVHTWPVFQHFAEIQNKYGRNIRITTFHDEEWTIFESLSPDVNLKEILQAYKIKTYEATLLESEETENRARRL